MTEEKKYEPPERSKGDIAHGATRAILSVVPWIGGSAVELFQFVIAPPLERRRDEWMRLIGEAIRDLEAGRRVKPEDLQENWPASQKLIQTLS